MIDKDRIKAEAEAFFDWPTSDKSKVTTASMLIFAGVIAEMARKEALEQAQQRIAELDAERDEWVRQWNKERLVIERADIVLIEQNNQMREALEYAIEYWCGPKSSEPMRRALSTQPAADLIAAHDAKVIERCAEVCRALMPTQEQLDAAESKGGFSFSEVTRWCHDAIRALIAAPKQGETKEVE